MPLNASIVELIDKRDCFEFVGDRIAEILKVEETEQRRLARIAGKDPMQWALRVFRERSSPWSEFEEASEDEGATLLPIVNVSLDSVTFDGARSNVVESQSATAVYNIDVVCAAAPAMRASYGHSPSDVVSALETQRAVRLVRNILMSAHHIYLQARGTVSRRFIGSIQSYQPQTDERATMRVGAARIQFHVDFREFAPQVIGVALEAVQVSTLRSPSGEVLLVAEFGEG